MQKMQKTNRLKEKYQKEIQFKLAEEFAIKNKIAVPSLVKVVVNAGIGGILKNEQGVEALKRDLASITGQSPAIRKAKKSIASFSIREGQVVGLAVTLRGERMYSFLDRLFSITLPRLRDFRGISNEAFDRAGNYTLGLTEHTIFSEVDLAKSAPAHGMEITIVTTAKNKEQSKRLLELLGCPFAKL